MYTVQCDSTLLLWPLGTAYTKLGICSKGQFSFFPILWSTGAARYTRMHRVNAVECNDIVSIHTILTETQKEVATQPAIANKAFKIITR